MTRHRGDPERIGEVLDEVLAAMGMARPAAAGRLLEEWAEIAGEPFASRARPVGLDDGVLYLEAADGAAASLLRYQTGDLLRRLEERLGRGLVTSVSLRVGRPRRG